MSSSYNIAQWRRTSMGVSQNWRSLPPPEKLTSLCLCHPWCECCRSDRATSVHNVIPMFLHKTYQRGYHQPSWEDVGFVRHPALLCYLWSHVGRGAEVAINSVCHCHLSGSLSTINVRRAFEYYLLVKLTSKSISLTSLLLSSHMMFEYFTSPWMYPALCIVESAWLFVNAKGMTELDLREALVWR